MPSDRIIVRGAREHNLKNIDVIIPRDQLVVITGLSGSGKSSLAFDTIFAEGQRRYVESLSSYARQFLGQMEKPDVDHIDGLSPAISIDQKSTSHNPRSTVGTVTEIYDFMRLLYARIGHPHCPKCGREVTRQSVEQIVDAVTALPDDTRLLLLAPLVKGRKGEYKNIFEDMRRAGYVRMRVDGEIRDLGEEIELDKNKQHTLEVVVDRLVIRHAQPEDAKIGRNGNTSGSPHTAGRGEGPHERGLVEDEDLALRVAERPALYAVDSTGAPQTDPDASQRSRIADSVETTLKLGDGVILVSIIGGEERLYSEKFACVYDGISFEELEPRSFSFNSPKGACPECTGLGTKLEIDEELVVTNPDLSIEEGAIQPWSRFAAASQWYTTILTAIAKRFGFSLDTPWKDLTDEARDIVLHGTPDEVSFYYRNRQGTRRQHETSFEGVIPNLERRYKEGSEAARQDIEQYMSARPCPVCHGARLRPEILAVTVGGRNIVEVGNLSILDARRFFDVLNAEPSIETAKIGKNGNSYDAASSLPVGSGVGGEEPSAIETATSGKNGKNGKSARSNRLRLVSGEDGGVVDAVTAGIVPLTARERIIANQIFKEIQARLGFLVDVGLDYLSINRSANTLSGGEAQRIRLATQIGSSLMGVLYILDEPSIGLHQRDNARLIRTLVSLRDLGNTLLVVEHDEDTMRAADHIIDIGPGAGEHGGYVVAEGTLEEIAANPRSLTGQYISGKRAIPDPVQPPSRQRTLLGYPWRARE